MTAVAKLASEKTMRTLAGLRLTDELVAYASVKPSGPFALHVEEEMLRRHAGGSPGDHVDETLLARVALHAQIAELCASLLAIANPKQSAGKLADVVLRRDVPRAAELGMWALKRRLEDAALAQKTPERFGRLAAQFPSFRDANEALVRGARSAVERALYAKKIAGFVEPSFCSIAGAARRLTELGANEFHESLNVAEFYDLAVVVDDVPSCYQALAAIHAAGIPVPGTVQDLIAAPRSNGFSALLTQITLEDVDEGGVVVLQVRVQTEQMSSVAHYGVLAPECYGQLALGSAPIEPSGLPFVDTLLDAAMSLDTVSPQGTKEKITVLAEGGGKRLVKPYLLARGATVLDLAYKIHTDVGSHASWARVNRRPVDLGTMLQQNDRVEIVMGETAERSAEDLNLVRTKSARKSLRHQIYKDHVTHGRQLIKQHLELRWSVLLGRAEIDRLAGEVAREKLHSVEELYRTISEEHRRTEQRREQDRDRRKSERAQRELQRRLSRRQEALEVPRAQAFDHDTRGRKFERDASSEKDLLTVGSVAAKLVESVSGGLAERAFSLDAPHIEWVPDVLPGETAPRARVKICWRCEPRPPEQILGIVLTRQVTAHRVGCKLLERAQPIPMRWRRSGRMVLSTLELFCEDRTRLVRDVCDRVVTCGAGLAETHATTDEFLVTRIALRVNTRNEVHLGELIEALGALPSVRTVELESTTLTPEQRDVVVSGAWRGLKRRQVRDRSHGPMLLEPGRGGGRRRPANVQIPYNEQRPVHDSHNFFGRAFEARELRDKVLADSPRFVFLVAPRRMGKTSLARHFAADLPASQRPHEFLVDLRTESTSSSWDVLRQIATTLRPLGGGQVHRHEDPRVEIANLVRRADRRVVLVLDEFGGALQSHENGLLGDELLVWIAGLLETSPAEERDGRLAAERLSLILVGPPEVQEALDKTDVSKHIGRLSRMHLSTMLPDDAHRMAIRPFQDAGVLVDQKAVDKLVTLTGSHPFVLIPCLKKLAERVNRTDYKQNVSTKDVDTIVDSYVDSPQMSALVSEPGGGSEQHASLHALARLATKADQAFDLTEIAGEAGLDLRRSGLALERLASYKLLHKHHASSQPVRYGFTIPLMRSWLMYRENSDLGEPSLAAVASRA